MIRLARSLVAAVTLVALAHPGLAAEDPVAGPLPPAVAKSDTGADGQNHVSKKKKAKKWRSKRKKKATASLVAPSADAQLKTGPVQAPPPLGSPAEARPADLSATATKIRQSSLTASSSSLGPRAMGVAVASASAAEGASVPAPAATPAPAASPADVSVWDTHLAGATAPSTSPFRKLRLFGHAAINHWEGNRNVGLRAGPRGTTDIWDAVIGVESRLSEDFEVRVRALTIAPAFANDGDGAAGGNLTNANKDFLYMRDIYIGMLHLFHVDALNLRFGRVPVSFGDESRQYDAPDNPLVSHSVAFFNGFQQGLQLYGDISDEWSYVANINGDNHLGNGADPFESKSYGLKLDFNHKEWHASASYYDAGRTGSAQQLGLFYFGRELAAPVGLTGAPGGASKSTDIFSEWAEADLAYKWKKGYVAVAAGEGHIADDGVHNRHFHWHKVEPLVQVSRKLDVVGRYSKIYVDNPALGYRFNSIETIGIDLNFDVHARDRASLGLRYRANEAVAFRLEHTLDRWRLIPKPLPATLTADPDKRDYSVLSAVVTF